MVLGGLMVPPGGPREAYSPASNFAYSGLSFENT